MDGWKKQPNVGRKVGPRNQKTTMLKKHSGGSGICFFFRNHRFISDVFFVGDSVCLIHLLDAEMWICTALIVHIFLSHVLSTPLCLFLKRIPTPPCKILFLRGAGLWLFSRSLIKILFHLVDGRKPCTNCHVWILRRGLPGPPCSSDCWSPSPSSQVAKTLVN